MIGEQPEVARAPKNNRRIVTCERKRDAIFAQGTSMLRRLQREQTFRALLSNGGGATLKSNPSTTEALQPRAQVIVKRKRIFRFSALERARISVVT